MSNQVFEGKEIIDESWKRCYKVGLNPKDKVIDQIISGKQLQEVIKENQKLINHAAPIFNKLFPYINQTGHVAVLVSNCGTIIHTASGAVIEDEAKKVQLQVGANWHERYKGTNAMGVALIEEKPVRVHGEQHFYVSNHFLTCAACPIYSPTGELMGAINISGRKEQFNPFTLSLVCMIAESLQSRYLIEEVKQEHVLTLKELEHTANFHPYPLLSLDEEQRIIRANNAARRILGKDCIGKEFYGGEGFVVETITDNTKKVWRSVAIFGEDKKNRNLYTFNDIFGSCPHMLRVKELAQKTSQIDLPVLLFGESGTGKELFAQSIHSSSSRYLHPFIAVNCSSIPESLVESELFGYEKGAFTGANREGGKGKFEAAHHGTVFLDEIGDMSLHAQAALLRVLQEKTITRVGGNNSIPVDIRIIAATNKNLLKEIKAGRFREDLYYRLKGIQINLPPLRERSDIIEMAQHLLEKMNFPSEMISNEAKKKLLSYQWPGNVRELHSVLTEATFLAEGNQITPEHLNFDSAFIDDQDRDEELILSLIEAEMVAIKKSLRVTSGNISKAAKLLKIGRNTLYRKIKEYDIHQY